MKRIISLILTVSMLICVFTSSSIIVNGATTYTSGDFKYTVSEEGTATITKYTGNETVLNIPSVINNYVVTTIGYSAFRRCTSLENIIIPNSITKIESTAFNSCTGLNSITIPDTVTSLGPHAFSGCTSLVDVVLGKGITTIEYNTFAACKSLQSIIIPDNVTSLGNDVFYNCNNLTSITLSPSVSKIDHGTFDNCTSIKKIYITDITAWCNIDFVNSHSNPLYHGANLYLNNKLVTNLVLPYGTTNICKYAFYGYKNLTSVSIPDSVTKIGSFAFADTKLSNITIPDSITVVGDYALAYCKDLTNVTLSENLNRINSCLFYDCQNLQSVYIPFKITNIGKYAFYNCKKLKRIDIYNSKCSIYNSVDTIDSAITIGCRPDSPLHTYAKENGKKYELIDNHIHIWGSNKIIQQVTCTKDGKIESICTVCGNTKQVIQKAKGHHIVINKSVAATCTKAGKTEEKKCYVCKKVLVAQKTIPQKKHQKQQIKQYISTGYKYTIKCKTCNKIFSKGVTHYLSTPTFTAKAGNNTIIINYKNVKKAEGYQVRYIKGNTTVTITYNSSQAAQKTLKKIKKGTYKVFVRAFTTRKDTRVYSPWSKSKTVKVN